MAVPALRDQFAAAKQGSLQQLNGRLVDIAKLANAGIMALDPKPVGFIRIVDGITGRREEAVKPNGIIVYQYQRLDIVIDFALDTLSKLSPRSSGDYAAAHTAFVNGIAVQPPYVIGASDDVAISNLEPYARKIEVGKMHMTVPGTDHVYQQAQQIVQRQYGALVTVEFTWRSLATKANQIRIVRKKKGRTSEHALQTQPALVFHLR